MESTGLPSVQAEVIHLLEMIHHLKDPPHPECLIYSSITDHSELSVLLDLTTSACCSFSYFTAAFECHPLISPLILCRTLPTAVNQAILFSNFKSVIKPSLSTPSAYGQVFFTAELLDTKVRPLFITNIV